MRRFGSIPLVAILFLPAPALAYIEAAMTLGDVINQSNMITILRVTKVDKTNKIIVYEKVEDIRGKFPTATCRHVITGQLRDGEVKTVLDWAEPGKTAIFFAKDGACETCIDNYWYQIYKGGDDAYGMSHGEPFLLRSYAGKADRLPAIVRAMIDGKELAVPCMEDNKELLHKRAARMQRMKASLKIVTYDPKRDFVGWGGEDIRRIPGGTGFSHIAPLSRVDAEARSAIAVDFDNDGKLDVCIVGTSGVRLFQNQGDAYSEVSLPGHKGGARSASWGDADGDGKIDLLLATVDGPRLFTNLGNGQFRDDTAKLPKGAVGATAVAWIDADGDGRTDVLIGTAFSGLRLFRNIGGGQPFADVSTAWNLGAAGLAAEGPIDWVAVADLNGDGRPDVLVGAGNGLLLTNADGHFELARDSGLNFAPQRTGPGLFDFDGDGHLDLFVPQAGKCKLYRNDGQAHFTDVIDRTGDLAKAIPGATSAAWGDLNNDGLPDLIVGCLRGPNRYLQNNGNGTFTDQTEDIGLTGRVFNTQAVAVADLNNDGRLDVLMANEGQESAILLGNKERPSKGTPVVVHVPGEAVGPTTQVKLVGKDGPYSRPLLSGGGRGQADMAPRFVVPPGTYRVEVFVRNGKNVSQEVAVAGDPVRVRFDAKAPAKK